MGANIRGALDFIAKLPMALKERSERECWSDLLIEKGSVLL